MHSNYALREGLNSQYLFESDGSFKAAIYGVGIKGDYRFATLKKPYGVNSFFKVSLDKSALKKQVDWEDLQRSKFETYKAELLESQLNSLQNIEELEGNMRRKLQVESVKSLELSRLQDFLHNKKTPTSIEDKLLLSDFKRSSTLDSLSLISVQDSLSLIQEKIFNKISYLQDNLDKVSALKSKISSYQSNLVGSPQVSEGRSGIIAFLLSLKKLDLGLTTPSLNPKVSRGSIPIQGINLEAQSGRYFYAVSAGFTVNNRIYNPNIVDQSILYSKNVFNYFDFSEITKRQFMSQIRGGLGTPEANHIFVGSKFLQGDSIQNAVSFGVDLDISYLFKKLHNLKVDLYLGKSSYTQQLIGQANTLSQTSSFALNDQTGVYYISLNKRIKKLRTDLESDFQRVDRNVNYLNMGLLNNNFQRAGFKSRHQISSKFILGTMAKVEMGGVDRKVDSLVHLKTWGINAQYKVGNLIAFADIKRAEFSNSTDELQNRKSSMYNLGSVFPISTDYFKGSLTLSHNEMAILIQNDLQNFRSSSFQITSQNFSFSSSLQLARNEIENEMSKATSYLVSLSHVAKWKYFTSNIVLKYLESDTYKRDLGFKMEGYGTNKQNYSLKLSVEKMVVGEFFNYLLMEQIKQFPYLISMHLNVKIK